MIHDDMDPGAAVAEARWPGTRATRRSRRKSRRAAVAVVLVAGAAMFATSVQTEAATQVSFTTYALPTPAVGADALTTGSDGNLWSTALFAHSIARITPQGAVTLFPVRRAKALYGITAGPDGNLWFTDLRADFIGRITTSGHISEFHVPNDAVLEPWKSQGYGQAPDNITTGPDGNLWFTEFATDRVVQILPNGKFGKDYVLPRHPGLPATDADASAPDWITTGADGNLWFTESRFGGGPLVGNRVTRLTLDGVFTEFPIPTVDSRPHGIALGTDGRLWFTEEAANNIAAVATSGQITEYAIPTAGTFPEQIVQGPDGAMWFTEGAGSAPGLGRIDVSGIVSEFASPTPPSTPQGIGAVGIALGPDSNIWFTEIQPNTIIRAVISS